MGKNKAKVGYKPAFVMHKKPQIGEPVKRQKIGDGTKDKVKSINTKVLGEVEVTVVGKNLVKTLGEYQELNRAALKFDFNSKEDFNPDADSLAVA